MAVSDTPILLPTKAQEGLIDFVRQAVALSDKADNSYSRMEEVDRVYARETDLTEEQRRAKSANKYGDSSRTQNIVVPVVAPQVEAFVTYQTSVFLTGNPIFGVTSSPQYIDNALQMETVIEDQAIKGGWTRELQMFFRDGAKYNTSAVEVSWERKVTAAIETDIEFSSKTGKPKEVVWEGNKVTRLDPYNTIRDPRVPATAISTEGDFAGYRRRMTRTALKQFINSLPDKMIDNVKAAFESAQVNRYYVPSINPAAFDTENRPGEMNWESWAGITSTKESSKIQYKNTYEVTTLYVRIIPSDFGIKVPSPNTPQVWKLILVNDSVLIYAMRQTNAHGLIPILFGVPKEDGLSSQTKSFAQNAEPFQSVATSLMNSVLASRRRAISDRGLFDPSKVAEHLINSTNPSAKIPVKPSAYGKPLSEAYYPIPFRDDSAGTLIQEIQLLQGMANQQAGMNQARQGQFVKGNKTLREYESVMSNASGPDQMTSILYEAQVFTPLKEILKLNILQYQGGTSLYNREREEVVPIDPVALRKAVLEFKVSDGLVPTEKLINGESWTVAMQVIGSTPQISQAYNFSQLFSYLMKTKGANLKAFEKSPEQLAYEQALGAWQQAAQSFADKGIEFKQPQPTPEQFGYQVAQSPLTQTPQ